jgi:hypothetical protein
MGNSRHPPYHEYGDRCQRTVELQDESVVPWTPGWRKLSLCTPRRVVVPEAAELGSWLNLYATVV